MFITKSIKKYVGDLSARKSVPGGGSASGLSGALGIALLEMVCNFTMGNKKYKSFEEDIKKYLASLEKIREDFSFLIDEDVRIYSAIRDAFKSKNKKIIDKALKDGYYISLKICRLSNKGLEIAELLSEKGNVNLITDVGCGAELLNATFNCGVFNAGINMKGIKDIRFVEKGKKELSELKKYMEKLYRETVKNTKDKMR